MKHFSKTLLLVLLVILFMMVAIPSAAQNAPDVLNSNTIQTQIDKLLEEYDKALQNELQNGKTIEVNDPIEEGKTRMLTGESAAKMDALWQETVKKINDLSARSQAERETVIKFLQGVESNDIIYIDQDRTLYSVNAKLERYQSDKYIYSVDIQSGLIIEIRLVDERDYGLEAAYSKDDLEKVAREFIAKMANGIELDKLALTVGNKEGILFFRWEDTKTTALDTGTTPFVQVGISPSGDIVHYINTLPLPRSDNKAGDTSNAFFAPTAFNEVYANESTTYWQWLGGLYEITAGGYCGNSAVGGGWCSPYKFRYQKSCQEGYTYPHAYCPKGGASGRWKPNTNPNVKVAAFIPSTHATMVDAHYTIYYNGGSSVTYPLVNQSIYYNTWVSLASSTFYNVKRVELNNTKSEACCSVKEVAWDETWVYTP